MNVHEVSALLRLGRELDARKTSSVAIDVFPAHEIFALGGLTAGGIVTSKKLDERSVFCVELTPHGVGVLATLRAAVAATSSLTAAKASEFTPALEAAWKTLKALVANYDFASGGSVDPKMRIKLMKDARALVGEPKQ